jgi:lipopolysaccharide transport system permease protein
MSVEAFDENAELVAYRLKPKTGIKVALNDIVEAFAKYRLALIFGWQDVAQRYRRS